jgi:PKD repeat protein
LNVNFDGSASFEPFGACGTINSYTLDFGDGSPLVTQSSPLFSHTYNNVGFYPARLTVSNTLGQASVNQAQVVISVESSQIQLGGVVSRKVHGAAGTFDIILPLSGPRAVECRSPGQTGTTGVDYKLIFVFPDTLTSVASVSATATGPTQPGPSSGSIGADAHQYIVNLTAAPSTQFPNGQYVTVTLNNAHDSANHAGNVSATFGVLLGDVNGDVNHNGIVDSGDVFLVRQQTGQTTTSTNFRKDINASGLIDSGDVFLTRQRTGSSLPTPP